MQLRPLAEFLVRWGEYGRLADHCTWLTTYGGSVFDGFDLRLLVVEIASLG
jgi:hypothetical protein